MNESLSTFFVRPGEFTFCDPARLYDRKIMNLRRIALLVAALGVVVAVCVQYGTNLLDSAKETVTALPTPGRPPVQVVTPPPEKGGPGKNVGINVAKENALPGTTDWKLKNPGPQNAIEGYADRVSVDPGDKFGLYVSTPARDFQVEAYRMGWYDGKQGRLVWSSDRVRGQRQAAAETTPQIYMARAPWKRSLEVSTQGWPEGDYRLKLVSAAGHDRWVPLTVRSKSAEGRSVFINAVATWAAYNSWGGANIYGGIKGYGDRARKVSFDRPYSGAGDGLFGWHELPMLTLAERMGIPLAYGTSLELDSEPARFKGARGMIFPSHDEYWSSGMRTNTIALRDKGVNLAFFGANNAYRHVRFESSPLGAERVVTCYKDAAEDPMSLTDTDEATQQWRQAPNPRPESSFLGIQYEWAGVLAPYVVTDPNVWMYKGTGAHAGSQYPGLVRSEFDRVFSDGNTPRPIQILSNSPVVINGKDKSFANSSYYTTVSGAGVFSAGTLGWTCAVDASPCWGKLPKETGKFATKVAENIISAFQAGPAAKAHPAVDNYEKYARPTGRFKYNM
ncbi:N,N-dimethylformamidase beta subunit family domain-containing protein [Streptomyces sp. RKAG293]|uniref:N,N-dimethylformamidase beta subunit family domain-containing protein n=1 Tax=Streptomyces sp. RKAG293 TaxID=2893403 RepID=UPI0020342E5C|nr:N,N-dimethylformamidase beta subunit family domain-containing protein [Streptomyces sp. RKAG293]MCM2419947.1 hypothetical protein [Streptomyces sp. RKAG293]